ncbi:Uu.00g128370.m01.CDS01 [Anthostomella pinea]|uniref:Uu.00g128370.m01.CDS01 n=1 Tax=Anthostomella pinea TaxID=933095 RepID=A0AAI8YFK0_9PEZI|nr:Uu.00g128370.m01.CDS01 [Anthostomella pinea]
MDLAYDHIAEESLKRDNQAANDKNDNRESSETKAEPQSTLNDDIQAAYSAFSSSTWGSWLGGTVGKVVKQGESVYREASQEVTSLGVDASRGLASLRARAISMTVAPTAESSASQTSVSQDKDKEAGSTTPTTAKATTSSPSSSDDALQESETTFSRLRAEAAKRLKDIQRAEDAADEALLKFGGNVRDFFRDAITVKPSAESGDGADGRFESKDEAGKRVIHTSRYDAQLHVLHTTEKSFTEDPATGEFVAWAEGFDAEAKTESISADLAKYPELRANMEKLVPDKVPYADFWKRYYFLRHSIDSADARRRDLMKAASAEEEIGWGEESDDEAAPSKTVEKLLPLRPGSTESSTTIHPPVDKSRLKPSEPRKSNDEKSQADSDTSYDVVGAASGNPSQAPSSPKEARKVEDSDDEEWE